MSKRAIFLLMFVCHCIFGISQPPIVGAYYFDGWSGRRPVTETWSKGLPSNVTKLLKETYDDREPIWGWRDNEVTIMEKQIDLASKNGIDCFVFCWYWKDDKSRINRAAIDSLCYNTSINLFLRAKNKNKMKFCVLVCNHSGFEIDEHNDWLDAIEYLDDHYLHDSQYLRIDNKPVIAFYSPNKVLGSLDDLNELSKSRGHDAGLFTIGINSFSGKFNANTWYAMLTPESGKEKSYSDLVSFAERNWYHKDICNVFPLVMAGWDRRPIDPVNSDYYLNRTPKQFYTHLYNAFACLYEANLQHNLLFIYAWNELAEGDYLVPTKSDKSNYLKQLKKVRKKWNKRFSTKN